jgi:hypothetical protein
MIRHASTLAAACIMLPGCVVVPQAPRYSYRQPLPAYEQVVLSPSPAQPCTCAAAAPAATQPATDDNRTLVAEDQTPRADNMQPDPARSLYPPHHPLISEPPPDAPPASGSFNLSPVIGE